MRRLFFLFTTIFLLLTLLLPSSAKAQNKCGVNVGPYYDQVDKVKNMTKEGGWIVVLGTLGDCPNYSNVFGKGLNVVLRAYNAGQDFDESQAHAWVATLGQLDTKNQKVYFMPWNEPNQKGEASNFNSATLSYEYVQKLKSLLDEAGLLNTKVVLLSPMVNKTHPNFMPGANPYFFSSIDKTKYYELANGNSINEYDWATGENNYQPCSSAPPTNNCKYKEIGIPTSRPFYALESGVVNSCSGPPCYRDHELRQMLDASWQVWKNDPLFKMFAIFSYDPHKNEPGALAVRKNWDIFSASAVKSFYSAQCSAGGVDAISGFDQTKFDQWLNNNQDKLVKCNDQCGFAPKDRPGLCSPVGKDSEEGGYDTSKFDKYLLDQNQFYLYPLKSLETKNVNAIRDELVDQGYQAFCATPKYFLNVSLGPQDIVKKFFDLGNKPISMPFNSKFILDFSNAQIPIFRDTRNKRFLFASMEEFFGFLDTKDPDSISQTELNSGPVNSLLDKEQRCKNGLRLLVQTRILCDRLKDPNSCALYKEEIPDTDFTYGDLSYKVTHDPKPSDISKPCQSWLKDHPDDENIQKMVRAIYKTPLYLDRAYRLAFLVMSVRQKPKKKDRLFNFFLKDNEKADWDETLVIAFKIPDVGTNDPISEVEKRQARNKALLDGSWDRNKIKDNFEEKIDPLKFTQKSLMTFGQQMNQDKTRKQFTQELKASASASFHQDKNKDLIYCANQGNACNPQDSPLGRALIDLINGQNRAPNLQKQMACDKTDFEETEIIGDNANLDEADKKQTLFKDAFGRQILNYLLKQNPDEANEQAEVEIKSEYQVSPNTYKQGGQTEVNFYLVYPAGYELEQIEKYLAGAFFTVEELKSLNYRDPYKKTGFPMIDEEKSFSHGSKSHQFIVGYDGYEEECPLNAKGAKQCVKVPKPKTKSFMASISDLISDPTRVLGGGIGYFMRIIQLNLNHLNGAPRAYLAQCKTTEEYLLGRCSGEDVAPRYIKTNPSTIVGDYCSAQKDVVTNETTNYSICEGDAGGTTCQKEVSPSSNNYFLEENSPYKIKLASATIDGATLITTGTLVPMNPGQWQKAFGFENRSCSGHDRAHFEIWYLPDSVSDLDAMRYDTWRAKAIKLKYHADPNQSDDTGYMNLTVSLNVKAGRYAIFTHEGACINENKIIVTESGEKPAETVVRYGIPTSQLIRFNLGRDSDQNQYCSKITFNSNMPGKKPGVDERVDYMNSSKPEDEQDPTCKLNTQYDIGLNNMCGGLKGDREHQNGVCKGYQQDTLKNILEDLKNKNKEALDLYLSITGRHSLDLSFINSSTCCREIFPSVIREFSESECPIN